MPRNLDSVSFLVSMRKQSPAVKVCSVLLSHISTVDRMSDNGLKLYQGKFRLGKLGKNSFQKE